MLNIRLTILGLFSLLEGRLINLAMATQLFHVILADRFCRPSIRIYSSSGVTSTSRYPRALIPFAVVFSLPKRQYFRISSTSRFSQLCWAKNAQACELRTVTVRLLSELAESTTSSTSSK